MPQLANVVPVAGTGAAEAAGAAPDQAVAAAFQMPAAAAESVVDASTATARSPRRLQRGETLPEGGNLLPLVVGLLPPVTSLAAVSASAGATDTAATPAPATPPALASLAHAARTPIERGSKAAPPPRPAGSAFDHLLASNLPAEVRAALAAALESSASPAGSDDTAATPAPPATSPPLAGGMAADASEATLPLLASPPPVAPEEDPRGPLQDLPMARAATPSPGASPLSATAALERHDAASAPTAAATVTLASAAPESVRDPGSRSEHDADLAVAADPPTPAFTPLLPGAPRAAEGGAVMNLATPVGSPGWSDALGERVAWLVQQDLGHAHLKLNPPQLGPVEVRVQINGDQAAVSFTAHNQQTRDALSDASQRLRDLLGAQGFVNVQVDVGQQPFQERPMLFAPYEDDTTSTTAASSARAPTALPAARGARVLLDAYA